MKWNSIIYSIIYFDTMILLDGKDQQDNLMGRGGSLILELHLSKT